jgi:gas vesicle protein
MAQSSSKKNKGLGILTFLGGLAAGAAAVFFSDKENREKVADAAQDAAKKAKEMKKEAVKEAAAVKKQVKKKVAKAKKQVKKAKKK